jgi:hypothetical protein
MQGIRRGGFVLGCGIIKGGLVVTEIVAEVVGVDSGGALYL